MRGTWRVVLVSVVVLALVLGTAAAQRGGSRKGGVLAPLKAGQKVSLREKAGGWEISMVPGVDLGHKVVEVGPDFVVLEDIAGVTETRIPIHALRAVTITRLGSR